MSAELLVPSSLEPPRTSTPLGPHSMSPEKQPPSPFEQLSSFETAQSPPSSNPFNSEEPSRITLGRGLPVPPKAPSIESAFSSIQGKTAGSPPQDDQQSRDDVSDSSIWDEDELPVASNPVAQDTAATPRMNQAAENRPDWMTEDLDESWPDPQSTPKEATLPKSVKQTMLRATADATQTEFQSMDPMNSPPHTRRQLSSVTPSSRAFFVPNDVAASSDPAFSAARRQARRALLKPRTPSLVSREGSVDPKLQAGPSTPSMRLASHLRTRSNLPDIPDHDENSDSTVWSESESDTHSAASVADDFASARGSLRENSRVTNLQSAQDTKLQARAQEPSPGSASTGSAMKGTFIHKADVSSLPPILRPVWQSPAKGPAGANRKGMAGIGGDMFTPMRLQTMFKTPTPPERPVNNIMTILTAPTANAVQEAARQAQITPSAASSARQTSSESGRQPSVPTSAFTFQSSITSQSASSRVGGMVLSRSMQDMQPTTLQVTTVNRPASAAANLGTLAIPSPALVSGTHLASGPPTPHTPMRLFKFNYDGADARAKLEQMVNENSPAAVKVQAPLQRADVERERKRLRLDVRPRKVITGDLMAMPTLPADVSQPQGVTDNKLSSKPRLPATDYVKESTGFMNTLQEVVRQRADNAEASPEQGASRDISFHQGSAADSPTRSTTSPSRQRRSHAHGDRRDPNVKAAVLEHQSPQRLSNRKVPVEIPSDGPIPSTLQSRRQSYERASTTARDTESPRKLLRRISAAAIAEDEVLQELENESYGDAGWISQIQSADTLVQRDQQIRELEERIARRRQERQLQTAQPAPQPQLITLHEPTLDSIHGRPKVALIPPLAWDELDEEDEEDQTAAQEPATRRFQDGIVLYDSERNLAPPKTDPTRTLRNVASNIELRNREPNGRVKQSTLLAHPSQSQAGTSVMNAHQPSDSLVSNQPLAELGGKGATITQSGSLINISQIPEEQIENLGRGKLTFNKELSKWEKTPASKASHEDLRSAAGSRNGAESTRIKTPIPTTILEASVETARDEDVFSDSRAEQEARTQSGAKANAFQQRLGNPSSASISGQERTSDSSDPFRDFDSFGQSSNGSEKPNYAHKPEMVSDVANEVLALPTRTEMREQAKQERALKRMERDAENAPPAVPKLAATSGSEMRQPLPARSPAARVQASTNVPRSGSSLRNVVTYSPDSTISSQHSAASARVADEPDLDPTGHHNRGLTGGTNLMSTPDRRPRPMHRQQHPMTPTPVASVSSLSTPRSILKQAGAGKGTDRARAPLAPVAAAAALGEGTPNRTISFADSPPRAKRNQPRNSELNYASARANAETSEVGDDRTEAISSALRALAELTLGDEDSQIRVMSRGATPSRLRDAVANRSHWSYRTLQRPHKTHRLPKGEGSDEEQDYDNWEQDDKYDEMHGYPDMTLLTDASFNLAHDKVLEAITDVEPWEPGWDDLQAIDLNGRRLESCVRLKEFLPLLEELNVYQNELSYLTGIPASLRILNVGSNRLTDMASFGHLLHLEELDISDNQIESLSHLSCLKHLHTLKANRNAVTSLDGIDKMRSLIHLSLSGNDIKGVNLNNTHWVALETLDVSHNALVSIRGLSAARRLKSLNLDYNQLTMVDLTPSMPKLRVLRVSGNINLSQLDVLAAPRLRTLYADYCNLTTIDNLDSLVHLDNLSMRQQAEASIVWPASQLRDVRRLFLSGNAFPSGIVSALSAKASNMADSNKLMLDVSPVITMRFLNLVYLELSACQLTQLPHDLATMAPNLRSLNLDHNLISSLPDLSGLQRLKRLSLVGCRVRKSKSIIGAVRGMLELQVIDTRTNPCTLGLYAPYVMPSSGPIQDTEGGYVASSLPPIPNAHLVQPDLAAAARRQAARQKQTRLDAVEKSFFHKRQRPATDYAVPSDLQHDEVVSTSPSTDVSTLFAAADARFVKTLPRQFFDRRALHRGLLAMACPKLDWIDGLLITQNEIEIADELVNSHRFDRSP